MTFVVRTRVRNVCIIVVSPRPKSKITLIIGDKATEPFRALALAKKSMSGSSDGSMRRDAAEDRALSTEIMTLDSTEYSVRVGCVFPEDAPAFRASPDGMTEDSSPAALPASCLSRLSSVVLLYLDVVKSLTLVVRVV